MQHLAYAPDEQGRAVERRIIIELSRSEDGTRWPRAELGNRLRCLEPRAMSALARLNRRGVIQIEGDTIECPDSANRRERLDALSGVVLHVLVCAHPRALTLGEVAKQCERDLARPEERHEVELALRWVERRRASPRSEWRLDCHPPGGAGRRAELLNGGSAMHEHRLSPDEPERHIDATILACCWGQTISGPGRSMRSNERSARRPPTASTGYTAAA